MLNFIPHSICLHNNNSLIAFQVASDVIIAICYVIIPYYLWKIVKKYPDLVENDIINIFANFIFSCGMTHVMDIIVVWYPIYWWQGVVKLWCAVASAIAVAYLSQVFYFVESLLSEETLSKLKQLKRLVVKDKNKT